MNSTKRSMQALNGGRHKCVSANSDARFGDSDFEGLMNFDEWEPDEATSLLFDFGAT